VTDLQVHLITEPAALPLTLQHTAHLVHAAYRIGPEGDLLTAALPPSLRGGWMLLHEENSNPPKESLAQQILSECIRRNYAGVLLDCDQSPTLSQSFLRELEHLLQNHHRELFIPEIYASSAAGSTVLICTAISGGDLREYLQEAQARYGKIALDLQRLQMDFSLPAPEGIGTPLTSGQLQQLRRGRPVYFSQPLCTHYFTYTRSACPHMVLFDDGVTLLEKIRLGRELGISHGFLLLPEVTDLLPQLFSSQEENKRT